MLDFTAPFNNLPTLKFKIQPTVTLFTSVNLCNGPLTKQKGLSQPGQKVMFVRSDWRILIHFVDFFIFCGPPVVAVILIDSSKTRKSLLGLKFRVRMLLKGAVNWLVCYLKGSWRAQFVTRVGFTFVTHCMRTFEKSLLQIQWEQKPFRVWSLL